MLSVSALLICLLGCENWDFIAISADWLGTILPRVTEEQPACQLVRFLSPDRVTLAVLAPAKLAAG
jgi:hypothetical protein